jgi:hypothetical protein
MEGPAVDEVFAQWEQLIRLVVLGRLLQVPENNTLLRQLQYVSPEIGMGRYCWNGECRNCEVHYTRGGSGPEMSGLACRVRGLPDMRLTRLSPEVRYDLAQALRSATAAED